MDTKPKSRYRHICVSPETMERWRRVKKLYGYKYNDRLVNYLLDTFEATIDDDVPVTKDKNPPTKRNRGDKVMVKILSKARKTPCVAPVENSSLCLPSASNIRLPPTLTSIDLPPPADCQTDTTSLDALCASRMRTCAGLVDKHMAVEIKKAKKMKETASRAAHGQLNKLCPKVWNVPYQIQERTRIADAVSQDDTEPAEGSEDSSDRTENVILPETAVYPDHSYILDPSSAPSTRGKVSSKLDKPNLPQQTDIPHQPVNTPQQTVVPLRLPASIYSESHLTADMFNSPQEIIIENGIYESLVPEERIVDAVSSVIQTSAGALAPHHMANVFVIAPVDDGTGGMINTDLGVTDDIRMDTINTDIGSAVSMDLGDVNVKQEMCDEDYQTVAACDEVCQWVLQDGHLKRTHVNTPS